MRWLWLAPITLGTAVALGTARAQPTAAADATWYIIVAQHGERLGHASHEVERGPDGVQVVDSQELLLETPDRGPLTRVTTRTVRMEDAAGRVTSIRHEAKVDASWARSTALIGPGGAQMTRETSSGRRSVTVALPPGVRFDAGEALLPAWDPTATPRPLRHRHLHRLLYQPHHHHRLRAFLDPAGLPADIRATTPRTLSNSASTLSGAASTPARSTVSSWRPNVPKAALIRVRSRR